MSIGSISVLARLSGAHRSPPKRLYRDGWPGDLQRAGQLAFSATQWCLHRRAAMVLVGAGLPAAKGALRVSSKLGLRDWLSGAYVMSGAAPSRLVMHLGLDASPAPELYLADADVLVVLGCRQGMQVVVHVAEDGQVGLFQYLRDAVGHLRRVEHHRRVAAAHHDLVAVGVLAGLVAEVHGDGAEAGAGNGIGRGHGEGRGLPKS